MRFVARAIEYEAKRQVEILEGGGRIDQETRLFDSAKGETRSMRSKEEAHDYRYFPDPDLLPLELEDGFVERIAGDPARAARRQEGPLRAATTASPAYDAGVLVAEARDGRLFRAGRQGPRRQAGGQLGRSTSCSACSARPARASRTARSLPASLGKLLDLLNDRR